jgi:hypothetical protein
MKKLKDLIDNKEAFDEFLTLKFMLFLPEANFEQVFYALKAKIKYLKELNVYFEKYYMKNFDTSAFNLHNFSHRIIIFVKDRLTKINLTLDAKPTY